MTNHRQKHHHSSPSSSSCVGGPALPSQSDAPVSSSFDGTRVNFLQHLGPTSALAPTLVRFPTDQKPSGPSNSQLEDYPGLYDSRMVCKRGVMGVNNQCMCPGSRDQMPFEQQTPQSIMYNTGILFSPFVPGGVPPLTPAAKYLVAQRSQVVSPDRLGSSSYFGLDQTLPQCRS